MRSRPGPCRSCARRSTTCSPTPASFPAPTPRAGSATSSRPTPATTCSRSTRTPSARRPAASPTSTTGRGCGCSSGATCSTASCRSCCSCRASATTPRPSGGRARSWRGPGTGACRPGTRVSPTSRWRASTWWWGSTPASTRTRISPRWKPRSPRRCGPGRTSSRPRCGTGAGTWRPAWADGARPFRRATATGTTPSRR